MQEDDKPVQGTPAPDTEVLTEIANHTPQEVQTTEPEAIDKPQLGPVVLGGKKSYRKQIGIVLLVLILLAIGGVLGYTYSQNKAAEKPAATSSDQAQ